jgi:preprotein translocase subunit SecA
VNPNPHSATRIHGLPRGLSARVLSLVGGPVQRRLARWSQLLERIQSQEPELQRKSDAELRKASRSLQFRAKSGEKLVALMPEAYALVREAGRRTLKMRHFDVQLIGGMSLFHGCLAEMGTGEGKTLTATLPMYLHSLLGRGCHLATVNATWPPATPSGCGPFMRCSG